jgi:hypothetical protein
MSQFIYLLNAFEGASQDDAPADVGYAEKRKAVLDYVAKLEADAQRYVPREATPAMIEAARAFRVNLQFGNQGISGPISPFEAREIWERMYEAAIRECEPHAAGDAGK